MLKVVLKYRDGSVDTAPVPMSGVEGLLQASHLARTFATTAFGVRLASVYNGDECITAFTEGGDVLDDKFRCISCQDFMHPAHDLSCSTSRGDTCVRCAPTMFHIVDDGVPIGIREVWRDGTVTRRIFATNAVMWRTERSLAATVDTGAAGIRTSRL